MAGITYDGIPSTQIDSSNFSGTNFYGSVGSIVGLRIGNTATPGSITALNITTTGSITEATGRLRSNTIGSPGAFGAIVQAGSFATTAGSTAAVAFRQNFTTANAYVFVAWPQSGLVSALQNAATAGSLNVVTSGTANNGKNTSGVNVVGGASFTYDYIAIGA